MVVPSHRRGLETPHGASSTATVDVLRSKYVHGDWTLPVVRIHWDVAKCTAGA